MGNVFAKDRFILMDKDCKLMGTANGETDVVSKNGDRSFSICTESKKKLSCQHFNPGTAQKISETEFQKVELGKNQLLLANEVRNIKAVVDLEKKEYRYAQINLLTDSGIILTKNCFGHSMYEQEYNKLVAEEEKKKKKSK